ncbi:MAG: bacillithiol biosynthesis deacetylase BshB1 [Planctomycetota bacterium]|nr:bacillithiol biosynthesis deacetylase BshB1 [Planctomycetota bacterium]
MPKQTVEYLVVAPHPDDAELGMGGTIIKLLAAGKRLAVLDLTSGEPTPFGTPAKRRRETAASSAALGLKVRLNLGLANRTLEATLAARVKVAEVYRTLRPRVLFIPYWRDAHPDHLAASRLATEARFHAKLTKTSMKGEPHYAGRVVYYYCTHLRTHDDVAFVVDVSGEFSTKVRAMECYRSQFFEGRGAEAGAVLRYVADANRYWGHMINRAYGEPFALQETLGLATPDCIV